MQKLHGRVAGLVILLLCSALATVRATGRSLLLPPERVSCFQLLHQHCAVSTSNRARQPSHVAHRTVVVHLQVIICRWDVATSTFLLKEIDLDKFSLSHVVVSDLAVKDTPHVGTL